MSTTKDFLLSGTLGDIQLGMLPETLLKRLGDAEDVSVKRRPVQILRYGSVEFGFVNVPDTDDSRLASIAIYFGRANRQMPANLRPTDWPFDPDSTSSAVRQWLADAGVSAEFVAQADEELLLIDSGASFVFADGALHSIHFRRREKKPGRTQLNVSIASETAERLRNDARAKHVSVGELLEGLLKQNR